MNLSNPLPNFPGKIPIGAGVSPLTNLLLDRREQLSGQMK